MNVQIINISNLKIIDYASSFVKNRHNTYYFAATRLAQKHDKLLIAEKWIWADVGFLIKTWYMIPYKKPFNDIWENRIFNLNLSRIRIKSEHAIDYFKDRFQSLKKLRIQIHKPENVSFVIIWVNVCIVLHSFYFDDELKIQRDWLNDDVKFKRQFKKDRDPKMNETSAPTFKNTAKRKTILKKGKKVRELLKNKLLDPNVL